MIRVGSPASVARAAGLLYLVVVVASVFALSTVSAFVTPDAATTATNIRNAEFVFRLAFAANLVAAVAYTGVVAVLCVLFWPVNPTLSLTAGFVGLAGCACSAAFMVNQLSALPLLSGAAAFDGFTVEQAQAMARHFLRVGGLGNAISLIFFGVYCVLLGALVLRAAFLPRVLAAPLMIAGLGWLGANFALVLAVDLPMARYLLPVSGLGELIFTLWLLAMGVDTARWRGQAGALTPPSA